MMTGSTPYTSFHHLFIVLKYGYHKVLSWAIPAYVTKDIYRYLWEITVAYHARMSIYDTLRGLLHQQPQE
jgi:hypothetical protein